MAAGRKCGPLNGRVNCICQDASLHVLQRAGLRPRPRNLDLNKASRSTEKTILTTTLMLLNTVLTQLLATCPAAIIPLASSVCTLLPEPADHAMPFRISSQYFNPSLYKSLRATWFEGVSDTARVAPDHANKRWFAFGSQDEKNAFDRVCNEKFKAALDSIGTSNYPLPPLPATYAAEKEEAPVLAEPFLTEIRSAKAPETSASTALSLLLLLDQMSRNVFRADQHLIYAHYDRISRAIVYTMLDPSNRWDLAYRSNFVYRSWFYMPLMHSEHIEDHRTIMQLCLEAQEDNAKEGGEEGRAYVQKTINFEKMHLELVERFGRYPHRNKVMGREATAAETEYLNSPNAQTFGTG